MMNREGFVEWLEDNTDISSYSIGRYAGAIDTLSSEIENYGLNGVNNLYKVTDIAIVNNILSNSEFKKKNSCY